MPPHPTITPEGQIQAPDEFGHSVTVGHLDRTPYREGWEYWGARDHYRTPRPAFACYGRALMAARVAFGGEQTQKRAA